MTSIEKELCQYNDTKKHISDLEFQLDDLLAKKKASLNKILRFEDTKLKDSGQYGAAVDIASKFADIYEKRAQRIADSLKRAFEKLDVIEQMVSCSGLCETEQQYVRLRYFKGLPLWRVEQELGYSERHTRRIRHGLLKKLEAST